VVDSAFSKLSPYYGYNGDEDQGQMGALSVLMKLGLFQMTGGCEENPKYELGSPLFDKVTITLQPGYYKAKNLVIETRNNGVLSPYIQSVLLNGQSLQSFYFRQSEINEGQRYGLKWDLRQIKNGGEPLQTKSIKPCPENAECIPVIQG